MLPLVLALGKIIKGQQQEELLPGVSSKKQLWNRSKKAVFKAKVSLQKEQQQQLKLQTHGRILEARQS